MPCRPAPPRAPLAAALATCLLLAGLACTGAGQRSGPADSNNPAAGGGVAGSAPSPPSAIAPGSASPGPGLGVSPVASPAAGGQTFTINMTDQRTFSPVALTVPQGASVTWQNTSSLPHTATADPAKARDKAKSAVPAGAQTFDSGNVGPGQNFSRTFDTPGAYLYVCTLHEGAGMVGTVTVQQR